MLHTHSVIMPSQQHPYLVALNLLFIFILFLTTHIALKNETLSKPKYYFALFLMFISCLFSFWGLDWFGYLTYYNAIKEGYEILTMESFYIWLVKNLCPHYLVFRTLVWGSALILLGRTVKRLKINKYISLFFFCCIYLIWFSYARATLAMALMFYGLSLFTSESVFKKSFEFPLAIACIIGSFFLHKTALFGIFVILIVILIKSSSKFAIVVSLFTFPLLVFITSRFLPDFIYNMMDTDMEIMNEYMERGNNYLGRDATIHGPGRMLQRFFEWTPYYLITFASIKVLFDKTIIIPNNIRTFLLTTVFITFCSSIFLFNLGMNTDTVFTRFIRYNIIPTCLSLSYIYQTHKYNRLIKFTYILAILGCFYAMIYSLYNADASFTAFS